MIEEIVEKGAETAKILAEKKAVELPLAIAEAKAITTAHNASSTPVPALLQQLKSIQTRYRWIKGFEAQAKGEGEYAILMIASEHIIDPSYTTGNLRIYGFGFQSSPLANKLEEAAAKAIGERGDKLLFVGDEAVGDALELTSSGQRKVDFVSVNSSREFILSEVKMSSGRVGVDIDYAITQLASTMTAIIAKVDNARINRLEIFIPEGASLRGSYAESGDLLVLIIDGKQEVTRLSGKAIHIVRVPIN